MSLGKIKKAHIEQGVAHLAQHGPAVVDAAVALQEDALLGARRARHIYRQQLEQVAPLLSAIESLSELCRGALQACQA